MYVAEHATCPKVAFSMLPVLDKNFKSKVPFLLHDGTLLHSLHGAAKIKEELCGHVCLNIKVHSGI